MRVRAKLLEAIDDWFKRHGYTRVQTPILVPESQELDPSSFRVKYLGKEFSLAKGACPHLEASMACLGKVYTITPAFRAERSLTTRHLVEFWRVECLAPEFVLEDIMEVQEMLTISICRYLLREASEDLLMLNRSLSRINSPFPRITYDEAIEMLQEDGIDILWGQEIEAEQEERLSQKFDKPFFISHYPLTAQNFFCKSHPQETELALVADLLAPEGYGEIASSGQMIDDFGELVNKMRSEEVDEKNYEWYLELKRIISYPYSGFANGIERLLRWICGLKHIEEVTLFPRHLNSAYR